jgi:hypothetical protein
VKKREYQSPTMVEYGSIERLTLGGSGNDIEIDLNGGGPIVIGGIGVNPGGNCGPGFQICLASL